MKKQFAVTLLAVMCLALSSLATAQNNSPRRFPVPLSKPGEQAHVELSLIYGNITVESYNGKEVIVEVVEQESQNYQGDRRAQGMTKIPKAGSDITITERNNKISIETESWRAPLDFVLKVPTNTSLSLKTINSGDIQVSGTKGTHELENVNGEITMNNIGGSVVAHTINGDIKGNFTSIDKEQPMAFSTLQGDIDLTLPANTKFTARMKSDNGDVYTDFEMDIRQEEPQVNTSNGNGYQLKIEGWVTGAANGGGPEYRFKTMQGDVYIRKK